MPYYSAVALLGRCALQLVAAGVGSRKERMRGLTDKAERQRPRPRYAAISSSNLSPPSPNLRSYFQGSPSLQLLASWWLVSAQAAKQTAFGATEGSVAQFLGEQAIDPVNGRLRKKAYCTMDADLSDYPPTRGILTIISNWNPDDSGRPEWLHDSLCHFDYQDAAERAIARRFREAELPFTVYNVPSVDSTVKKWSWDYLEAKLGPNASTVEMSDAGTGKENHFMFHRDSLAYKQAHPPHHIPSTFEQMTFREWLRQAMAVERNTSKQLLYMTRVSRQEPFIYDDLPLFARDQSFFIVEPEWYSGIHCRFGMRGIIAEGHFDTGRNMIAMLKGAKRYILMPPTECTKISLLPKGHPSYRHSRVDWSDPDIDKFPRFGSARALETVLEEGQVLYMPSHWIHYVQSLGTSVQCNCRSGVPLLDELYKIKGCGLYMNRGKRRWVRRKRKAAARYAAALAAGKAAGFHGTRYDRPP